MAGGTSAPHIKSLILPLIRSGSVLDFGAGQGELLSMLPAGDLTGVDFLPRPPLPNHVQWHSRDLNQPINLGRTYDTIVCSEVIEHLENPRQTFRSIASMLRPGGMLILTMPNQESIRSYLSLLTRGHFIQFVATCYPAHITALLRQDLLRLCAETGFESPKITFTNVGGIPKLPHITWQQVSLRLLRGRLFSDNVILTSFHR